jgi:hypothetical protein
MVVPWTTCQGAVENPCTVMFQVAILNSASQARSTETYSWWG